MGVARDLKQLGIGCFQGRKVLGRWVEVLLMNMNQFPSLTALSCPAGARLPNIAESCREAWNQERAFEEDPVWKPWKRELI